MMNDTTNDTTSTTTTSDTSRVPYYLPEWDIETLATNWTNSLAVGVDGYWSRDPITIYVRRGFRGDEWIVELTHSSGGREKDPMKPRGIEDDLEAEANFGRALVAASDLARAIRDMLPAIAARSRAIAEAEREAHEAALAADPAMTEERAALMVEALVVQAKLSPTKCATLTAYDRAAHTNPDGTREGKRVWQAVLTDSKRVTIRGCTNGYVTLAVSKAELVKALCKLSHADAVVTGAERPIGDVVR